MTIFFDFPKMCLKCHIWVFYRFWTLSRPQMADFRPYMKFPTTSGQYMKIKKFGLWGNFCNFGIIGRYMQWPEVAGSINYGWKHVLRGFQMPFHTYINGRSQLDQNISPFENLDFLPIFGDFDDFGKFDQIYKKTSKSSKIQIFKWRYISI